MFYDHFKNNVYSQNGEDGVLTKLIDELGLDINNMWLVDVGAYDGIAYSNLRKWIELGANAVMIEPCLVGGECEEKYLKLRHLPKLFPKVHTLNHFAKIQDQKRTDAGWEACKSYHQNLCNNYDFDPPKKTLDESLNDLSMNVPIDYDILNIDIDSYDHDVWMEHTFHPKIVIIEINSGLEPASVDSKDGTSFTDSLNVAKRKGYSAVCHTGNVIYVRNDLLSSLSIPQDLINSMSLFNRGWLT